MGDYDRYDDMDDKIRVGGDAKDRVRDAFGDRNGGGAGRDLDMDRGGDRDMDRSYGAGAAGAGALVHPYLIPDLFPTPFSFHIDLCEETTIAEIRPHGK